LRARGPFGSLARRRNVQVTPEDRVMAQRVRYPDHIEPLVEFVEETSPERIVAATHDKLAAGTPVKEMLLASALAVVRSSDLPPGHHGGPLHPLSCLHAVRHLSGRHPRPPRGEEHLLH